MALQNCDVNMTTWKKGEKEKKNGVRFIKRIKKNFKKNKQKYITL
jgi:hypothetical protein